MPFKTSIMYSVVGIASLAGIFYFPKKTELSLHAHRATWFPLGDAVYRLQRTTTDRPLPYTFCVLHENERTGSEAVLQFMRELGGQVWSLKAQGERNVTFRIQKKRFSFDPNRIFTDQGVANTLVMLSRNSPTPEAHSIVSTFGRRIIDSIFTKTTASPSIIVSVHNNTDGAYSALSHLPDSSNALGVRDIYINSVRDPDDFFYVTRRFDFNFFKNLGYNVILQDNKYIKDDGSLSVYCGKQRTRYINVEAQHKHFEEQKQMLYSVHELLKAVEPPPVAMLKPATPTNTENTVDSTKNNTENVKTSEKTPLLTEENTEDLPF